MSEDNMEKLERIVKFYPAFDKRSPEPSKNYGVHCVDLLMLVRGPKGAVQFKLFTGWYLPNVVKEHENRADHLFCHPTPADLGYHAHTPQYEDQEPISAECEWLGGPCYYDGSGLNAQRIYDVLLVEGDEGVWRELEEYYKELFNGS